MGFFTLVLTFIALVYGALQVFTKLNARKKRTKPYSHKVGDGDESETSAYRSIRTQNDGLVSTPASGATTLYENFENAVKNFGEGKCLGTRKCVSIHKETVKVNGIDKVLHKKQLEPFEYISYNEFHKRVSDYASGLRKIGLIPSEGQDTGASKLALYEETRLEWTLCEHACYRQSIVVVTVYANLGEEAFVHAINQGEIEVIQTNAANLKRIANLVEQIPTVKTIIFADALESSSEAAKKTLEEANLKIYSVEEVEKLGRENSYPASPPKPEHLAVIMYTSGSTGMPKGVLITHANLMASLAGVSNVVSIGPDDYYLSYLPLAHVLALAVENAALAYGATIGYGTSRTLSSTTVHNCKGDIQELRPTIFAGVPVIFDRIKSGVLNKVKQSSPLKKKLWDLAFESKKKALKNGEPSPFWDLLVFKKIQDMLGGRLRFLVSGGAPLSAQAHDFLRVVFGCPVSQGYGLTETCGAGTFQELDDYSNKCAGAPVPSVEIKLVSVPEMNYFSKNKQGEVHIRGAPVTTTGYYKNPEKTKEAYDEEGWFATGDIGQFTEDGRLNIIDRRKNLIKPPHGEYIAVERLESIYKNSSFVANILVHVDSEHSDCLGFVNPDFTALKHWAEQNNIPTDDMAKLCAHHSVNKAIVKDLLDTANTNKLKRIEQIKKVFVEPEEWTADNGLLTAAMKLARPTLRKHYQSQIDKLYGDK